MVDYTKAFTFLQEDERWLEKLGIGTVVLIVSSILSSVLIGVIGLFIVAGYCVRLLQNVRDGQVRPLPEWDQWSEDLIRGFKLVVVYFVWALPSLVFAVPLGIGTMISGGQNDAGDFFGVMLMICGGCLAGLYGIFLFVVSPGFVVAYARDEQIRSGLQFTEIIQWVRQNLSQALITNVIAAIGGLVISVVAGLAGFILCIIGLVITIPLGTLITYLYQYHLYGQLAANTASPVAPSSQLPLDLNTPEEPLNPPTVIP